VIVFNCREKFEFADEITGFGIWLLGFGI